MSKLLIFNPKIVLMLAMSFGLMRLNAQSLFIPSAQNTALFTESGELHISGMYGAGGLQGTAGYSLASGFALAASGTVLSTKNGAEYHKTSMGEIQVLFFDSYNEPLISQFSLGYGMGKASMLNYDSNSDSVPFENTFSRLYAQYNIGLTSKHLDAGFSLRVSHVYFPGYFLKGNPDISSSANLFTAEPCAYLSGGFKNIRLEAQASMPLILNDKTDASFNSVLLSGGVRVIFGRKYAVFE